MVKFGGAALFNRRTTQCHPPHFSTAVYTRDRSRRNLDPGRVIRRRALLIAPAIHRKDERPEQEEMQQRFFHQAFHGGGSVLYGFVLATG